MYEKTLVPTLMILLLFSLGFSINLELDFQGTYDNYEETFTDRIGIKLYNYTSNFDITSELAFYNDDKYYFYESDYYWDHYFLIENSYITLRNDDQTLELSGGIKQLKDEVNSPYSLFLSSNNIPLVNLDVGYEDEHFFFETMWVQLVSENNTNFATPTAMNYKTYGLKFGNFRVGYQDVLVYNRAFDFFYFLNPMPAYFAQEIRAIENRMPWWENINDNSIMGFFFDYKDPNYYIYSQLLVDDFNTNRFFNPEERQNPDKVAFSSGLNLASSLGTFGVYGAFATQYTFQPGGGPGYTIYPESIYSYEKNNVVFEEGIDFTDNYIGYKYGENTVSFLVDYDYTYNNWFNLYSSFETVFSGRKSPTENTAPDEGTYLLDDPLLEKRYVYTIATNFYFNNLEFNLSADMGVIQNKLEFNEVADTFEPSTEDENILKLNFGFGIEF
ncbi:MULTISPECIES: hypothetical protein [unclassified Petrotoga]|uniref:hypothetical protein n=1 Tax=unclassified Petrotoga TaxID=2620614 RepID=UPI000CA06D0B|nr:MULTISPECIES: hypothetical protein [unclassified Petrotoga]